MKEKTKQFFKTLWKYLDGNKTIIGLTMLNVLQLNPIKNKMSVEVFNLTISIITLLTGASLYHHQKKGFFTKSKGG